MSVAQTSLPVRRSELAEIWRRYRRSPAGVVGLLVVILVLAVAVLAPWLTPHSPTAVSRDRLQPPSPAHYFGTDNVGKDAWSGVLYGARVSISVGLLSALTSLTLGTLIGSLAGYYGGTLDSVLMRVSELFQTMPRFFLALVAISVLGGGTGLIIAVIGLVSWPATARIVRAEFMGLREREFVEAARAMGFSDRYIIFSEILPNALPPAIVQGTLDIASAILVEAGLSFFGLGNPDVASWGQMLNRAQSYFRSAWWLSVFPGAAIFVTVLAFNLVGDALNDTFAPELKER